MVKLSTTFVGIVLLVLPRGVLAQPAPARTAVVDGVRLQYVDWGGKGPALVLVPGACDTAFVFGDLAPRLTGMFHVLSLTPSGCAGSDRAQQFVDGVTLKSEFER